MDLISYPSFLLARSEIRSELKLDQVRVRVRLRKQVRVIVQFDKTNPKSIRPFPSLRQLTRAVPDSRRRETGAEKELVFRSKLWLNDESSSAAGSHRDNQTRDIECIVEELADAEFAIPVDARLNEVVPTQLTPVLRLHKVEDGLNSGGVEQTAFKLNEKVRRVH